MVDQQDTTPVGDRSGRALRIAVFGQAAFGRDVSLGLAAAGHAIVGVWTPPEERGPDPLAELARERGWPLHVRRHLRRRGVAPPDLLADYRALRPDLNVLPFTTAILPDEIAHHPVHGSICFHPSLLPAYRGGAALSWQIIRGEPSTGVSVFRIGEAVDCGPLLVQRGGVPIAPDDTMASLYFDKLYPLGVEAMLEAVAAIAEGSAHESPQPSSGGSWFGLVDDAVARIDWTRSAVEVERLIRGCDPAPGAHAEWEGRRLRLFDARPGPAAADRRDAERPRAAASAGAPPALRLPGTVLTIDADGLTVLAGDGSVRVRRVRLGDGPKCAASELGIQPGARLR